MQEDSKWSGKLNETSSAERLLPADSPECSNSTTLELYVPHHDEHEGRGHNFRKDLLAPSLRGPHGADNPLICSSADSPAKTSALRGSAEASLGNAPASSPKSSASPKPSSRPMDSSRMFQGCLALTPDGIWPRSLKDFGNAGLWSATQCWTASISESRNVAAACSLSAVLQKTVSPKYSLSPRAAAGILRRAAKRGRTLPPALEAALQNLASTHQGEAGRTI